MQKKINRLKVRTVCAIAASLLFAHAAWAIDPFTVRDIRVEGLQRVEPGTIFASLPFRVGETYSDDKGATAIRALFGLASPLTRHSLTGPNRNSNASTSTKACTP